MDKNTFETYEFLQSSNHRSEPEFLVVQEDATFLINRGVQYVTQIEDVKTALENQSCTMYNVSEQQLYIDVENSAELITVSDELIMQDGANNLFTSSYLMPVPAQPIASTEQVQENRVDETMAISESESQKMDTEQHIAEEDNTKQNTMFTEITLSDEQCQMLEQKGWIMLKSNDRIYVLDTLGLHDITNNEKLIQKLIYETAPNENDRNDTKLIKLSDDVTFSEDATLKTTDTKTEEQSDCETIKIVFENDNTTAVTSEIQDLPFVEDVAVNPTSDDVTMTNDEIEINQLPTKGNVNHETENLHNTEISKNDGVVRIRTDRCFKDIPDKLILGRTKSGKLLIAKRIRVNSEPMDCEDKKQPKLENNCNGSTDDDEADDLEDSENCSSEEISTDNILIELLQRDSITCTSQDIELAKSLILRLLQAPTLKKSIIQHKLALTRIQENYDQTGNLVNESDPVLVTGRMVLCKNNLQFQYQPQIVGELLGSEITKQNGIKNDNSNKILHIHVTENISYENTNEKKVTNSITLNERETPIIRLPNKIPPQLVPCVNSTKHSQEKQKEIKIEISKHSKKQSSKKVTPAKLQKIQARQSKVSFACGACATIFHTQTEIDEHQKTECTKSEENTKKNKIGCILLETEKGNIFACSFCMAKFTKLVSCQRHLSIHTNLKTNNKTESDKSLILPSVKNPGSTFKCKICSSTFKHSSTLSKHIVSVHVKVLDE